MSGTNTFGGGGNSPFGGNKNIPIAIAQPVTNSFGFGNTQQATTTAFGANTGFGTSALGGFGFGGAAATSPFGKPPSGNLGFGQQQTTVGTGFGGGFGQTQQPAANPVSILISGNFISLFTMSFILFV